MSESIFYSIAIKPTQIGYSAQVVDLPHITCTSDNVAQIVSDIRHQILAYLAQETRAPIPRPKELNAYLEMEEFAGCTWALVSVNAHHFTQVNKRLILDLPAPWFERLHRHLANTHQDKDAFLLKAIMRALEHEDAAVDA